MQIQEAIKQLARTTPPPPPPPKKEGLVSFYLYKHGFFYYCLSCERGLPMDQLFIDTKEKCRHLKKLTYKGTLQQVFIHLRPPPIQVFVWGGLVI